MIPQWLSNLEVVASVLWQGAAALLVLITGPKLWNALKVWQEVSTAKLRAERDLERSHREALEATLSRTSISIQALEKERESLSRQLDQAAEAGAKAALLGPTGTRANLVAAIADLMLVAVRLDIMGATALQLNRRAANLLSAASSGQLDAGAKALSQTAAQPPSQGVMDDVGILVGLQLATPMLLDGGPETLVKTIHSILSNHQDSQDILREAATIVERSEAYTKLRALGSTLHRDMTVAQSFGLPLDPPEVVSFGNGLVFDSRRRHTSGRPFSVSIDRKE